MIGTMMLIPVEGKADPLRISVDVRDEEGIIRADHVVLTRENE